MQGKKSFMIYKDMKRTVDDLTSDEAGNLFKAILDWQNGESVEKYDRMTRLLLQQMIVHFQREDEAWESKRAANAENGKKGGRPRNPENPVGFSKTHDNPDEPKKAVTVTVTGTVTETGMATKEESKPVFPGVLDCDSFKAKWIEYENYRRQSKYKKLKPLSVEKTLKKLEGWGLEMAVQSIDETIANGWQGLFPPKGRKIGSGAYIDPNEYPHGKWPNLTTSITAMSPREQLHAGVPDHERI